MSAAGAQVGRAAARFEPVEGRAIDGRAAPLTDAALAARPIEVLAPGDGPTWVVLPVLDEERSLGATLRALAAQTLRPLVLCVVDNGSTDGSLDVLRTWAASDARRGLGVRLVREPERGTGAAADTGMRVAIAAGARWLLRTDGDSLPRDDWAARMVHRLETDAELVAGRMATRDDEGLSLRERALLAVLVAASALISVPKNRGRGYRTRFRMLVGSNVGIRADTYVRAGGFPRSRIDEVHDDRVLMNRTRRITDRIASDHRAVVATSARRYRAYGLRGVLAWYLHHDSGGRPVDVRATDAGRARARTAAGGADRTTRAATTRAPGSAAQAVGSAADAVSPARAGASRRSAAWLWRRLPPARRAGLWEAALWLAVSPAAWVGLRVLGRRAVTRLGRFGTLVNEPALGRRILLDAERFRTVGPGTHGELIDRAIGPDALLNMDGPAHEALRRSLAPLFRGDAATRLVAATVDDPLADAVARLERGETVDLVRLFLVLTGRTAYALLGAPPPVDGDAGYLRSYRLGERLVGMTVQAIRRGARPAELELARTLVDELAEPGRAGWASGTGTLGRLRELGWDEAAARALVVVIVLAATETVSSAAPRIVALLHDHGRWADLDGGDPGAVERAIEAGLRLTTPTEVIVRSTARDTELDGHRFRAGERVFLSVYGMTRWPSLYEGDPEALRLGESLPRELRHLWFGAGPHFCLGAPIAREQLRRIVAALAAFPELRIVARRPARGVLFPAYGRLVVRA